MRLPLRESCSRAAKPGGDAEPALGTGLLLLLLLLLLLPVQPQRRVSAPPAFQSVSSAQSFTMSQAREGSLLRA